MTEAGGAVAELEQSVLTRAHETAEIFNQRGPWQPQGGRRALRFAMSELAWSAGSDDLGAFVELRFVLPPGCYATAVVGEITKG
jgi:tRNA(Glu) U13 pseudouridine synthase TruD